MLASQTSNASTCVLKTHISGPICMSRIYQWTGCIFRMPRHRCHTWCKLGLARWKVTIDALGEGITQKDYKMNILPVILICYSCPLDHIRLSLLPIRQPSRSGDVHIDYCQCFNINPDCISVP